MRLLVLVTLLLVGPVSDVVLAGEEVVRVPELQLPTVDGETAATWDYLGTPLLLVEFASW